MNKKEKKDINILINFINENYDNAFIHEEQDKTIVNDFLNKYKTCEIIIKYFIKFSKDDSMDSQAKHNLHWSSITESLEYCDLPIDVNNLEIVFGQSNDVNICAKEIRNILAHKNLKKYVELLKQNNDKYHSAMDKFINEIKEIISK